MMLLRLVILVLFVHSIFAVTVTPVPRNNQKPIRHLMESSLPLAEQTHEIVRVPNTNVVLISQMSNSVLVKAKVGPRGAILQLAAFQIDQPTSGLHGLANSRMYPGKVWITLEKQNKLILIDPLARSLFINARPRIIKEISVPAPGNGPHYVGEYGNELWVSLKESKHVLRINHRNPSDYSLYKALPNPIFVAQHPLNKLFYSSQDASSQILKIDPKSGATSQIEIPASAGKTPVGMISGPNGLWFTLLGSETEGTGTIGHLDANDQLVFHKLKSPLGADAALLHLAFDVNAARNHQLWLLSSSIINDKALDMVIKVTFDAEWKTIQAEDAIVLPTQKSKAHRILPTRLNVFATELASSKLLSVF